MRFTRCRAQTGSPQARPPVARSARAQTTKYRAADGSLRVLPATAKTITAPAWGWGTVRSRQGRGPHPPVAAPAGAAGRKVRRSRNARRCQACKSSATRRESCADGPRFQPDWSIVPVCAPPNQGYGCTTSSPPSNGRKARFWATKPRANPVISWMTNFEESARRPGSRPGHRLPLVAGSITKRRKRCHPAFAARPARKASYNRASPGSVNALLSALCVRDPLAPHQNFSQCRSPSNFSPSAASRRRALFAALTEPQRRLGPSGNDP